MKIEQIIVRKLRGISEVCINLSDETILIGPNNVGKSTILYALNIFCKGSNKLPDDDYTKDFNYEPIEIELFLTNLQEETITQFQTWLQQDKLRIVRVYTKGEKKYLQFSINESNERIQNPAGYNDILTGHLPSPIFIEGFSDPEKLSKFTGREKTPAKEILEWIFSEELKESSTYQAILKALKDSYEPLMPNYKREKEGERLKELEELERELKENLLGGFSANFIVDVDPPNIEDLVFLNAKLLLDDGNLTNIAYKGQGLQRTALFSIFRTWGNRLRRKEELEKGKKEKSSKAAPPRMPILFIEEPELYLHPQAELSLAASFESISQSGTQVICATHSSRFIDLSKPETIAFMKSRDRNGNVEICQSNLPSLSSSEKDKFKLLHQIDSRQAEMFFANRVVFVEGPGDRISIQIPAIKLNKLDLNVTLVETGGVDNMPFYIKLANEFKLNYLVMFDIDGENKKERNDNIFRLVDSADNVITWNPNLDSELGLESKKPFYLFNYWSSLPPNEYPQKIVQAVEKIFKGQR